MSDDWKASNPEEQCSMVERNGTDGYLCCGLRSGHSEAGVPHASVYGFGNGPWMTQDEWERNHGTAARSCYLPRRGSK